MNIQQDEIPIDSSVRQFLQTLWYQTNVVRQSLRDRKQDLALDSNRTGQFGVVKELLTRSRRQGPAAKMSKVEQAAIYGYAEYLVNHFHDLQGTPEDKRPHITFVPGGGVQWTTAQGLI